jgi:hypothetical protein
MKILRTSIVRNYSHPEMSAVQTGEIAAGDETFSISAQVRVALEMSIVTPENYKMFIEYLSGEDSLPDDKVVESALLADQFNWTDLLRKLLPRITPLLLRIYFEKEFVFNLDTQLNSFEELKKLLNLLNCDVDRFKTAAVNLIRQAAAGYVNMFNYSLQVFASEFPQYYYEASPNGHIFKKTINAAYIVAADGNRLEIVKICIANGADQHGKALFQCFYSSNLSVINYLTETFPNVMLEYHQVADTITSGLYTTEKLICMLKL